MALWESREGEGFCGDIRRLSTGTTQLDNPEKVDRNGASWINQIHPLWVSPLVLLPLFTLIIFYSYVRWCRKVTYVSFCLNGLPSGTEYMYNMDKPEVQLYYLKLYKIRHHLCMYIFMFSAQHREIYVIEGEISRSSLV